MSWSVLKNKCSFCKIIGNDKAKFPHSYTNLKKLLEYNTNLLNQNPGKKITFVISVILDSVNHME